MQHYQLQKRSEQQLTHTHDAISRPITTFLRLPTPTTILDVRKKKYDHHQFIKRISVNQLTHNHDTEKIKTNIVYANCIFLQNAM